MQKRFWMIWLLLCCTTPVFATSDFSQRKDVKAFIQQTSKKYHFSKDYLTKIFRSVKLHRGINQEIRAPKESNPWYSYQMIFVTEWRIRAGVKYWNEHEAILKKVEQEFGVPASIIVATIGVETKYGKRVGNYRVIDALSSLAFNNYHRTKFFRNELKEFLLLTREEKLDPLRVMGSYAGAIGQPQFMPSSYRRYAVNFSGRSRINLLNDDTNVIASIANYYEKQGWETNEPIVVPTLISKDYNRTNFIDNPKPFYLSKSELAKYGIMPKNSQADNYKVNLIRLDGNDSEEYWLGFHNFNVIKRYNNSNLYAMAVYQLSYYIEALKEKNKNA